MYILCSISYRLLIVVLFTFISHSLATDTTITAVYGTAYTYHYGVDDGATRYKCPTGVYWRKEAGGDIGTFTNNDARGLSVVYLLKENNYIFDNYTLSCYAGTSKEGTIYLNIIDARRIYISYSSPPHFDVLISDNITAPYKIPPLAQNIRISCVMEGCGWGTSTTRPVNPYYNISVMSINENIVITSYYKYFRSATDTRADKYKLLQITITTSGSSFGHEHSPTQYTILPTNSTLTVTSDITLACATDKTTDIANSIQWYYTSLDDTNLEHQITSNSLFSTSTGISTLLVTIDNTGVYICRVTIEDGSTNEYRIVQSIDPVRNVIAHSLSSKQIQIVWQPPVNVYGGLDYYEVKWRGVERDTRERYFILTTSSLLKQQYTIDYLQEDTRYNIEVTVYNVNGKKSIRSVKVTTRTLNDHPTEPPQNLVVTETSKTSIRVKWSPPRDIHQNGVITHYELTCSGYYPEDSTVRVESNVREYELNGLEEFTLYSISVRAFTSYEAGPAAAVVERTKMDRPKIAVQHLQSTITTHNAIKLTWDDISIRDRNGANIRYIIYDSLGHLLTTPDTSVIIYNLAPYTHYKYIVQVSNDYGTGPKREITVATKPVAPSKSALDLTAHIITPTSIKLTWMLPRKSALYGPSAYYIITYIGTRYEPKPKSVKIPIGSNFQQSSIISGLNEYDVYTFNIKLYNTVGIGENVKIDGILTPQDKPSTPPGCYNITVKSGSSALVEWCAPTAISQNGLLTGFSLTYAEDKFNIPPKTLKLNPTVLEYLIEDLEEDDLYTFTLSAVNSVGAGPAAIATAQTPQKAPSAPVNDVQTTAIKESSIRVNFNNIPHVHQNGDIQHCSVKYRVSNSIFRWKSNISSSNVLNSNNTVYVILVNLLPFTDYEISITCENTIGESPAVTVHQRTNPKILTKQPVIKNVLPCALSTFQYIIWDSLDKVYGITHYTVMYSHSGSNFDTSAVSVNTTKIYTSVVGLDNTKHYIFKLTAHNVMGSSPSSDVHTC